MPLDFSYFLLGDAFGFLALLLIGFTAVFRRMHIIIAALGGLFLVSHAAYFIEYTLNLTIVLGYVSTTIALAVWLTGTAFLERFRDSLYFHSTLSLSAVSLMIIHSAAAGANLPLLLAALLLASTVIVGTVKSAQYIRKMKAA
jgi:hypothetical protein